MNGSKELKSFSTETGLNDLSSEELTFHSWNCAETGFCTAAAAKKIPVKQGD